MCTDWHRLLHLAEVGESFDLEDDSLLPAYMTVQLDTTAAERGLLGSIRLADPTYDPATLTSIREAIMQEPSDIIRTRMNLFTRRHDAWETFKAEQNEACGDSKKRYECNTYIESRRWRILATGQGLNFRQSIEDLGYCYLGTNCVDGGL